MNNTHAVKEEHNHTCSISHITVPPTTLSTMDPTPSTYVPVECWLMVFEFIKPCEEFPLATVCSEWRSIFTYERERREQKQWYTNVRKFTNKVSRLEWATMNNYKWKPSFVEHACADGHVEAVKWALCHGALSLRSKYTCVLAMKRHPFCYRCICVILVKEGPFERNRLTVFEWEIVKDFWYCRGLKHKQITFLSLPDLRSWATSHQCPPDLLKLI
jgi:hypothetical protein